MLLKRIDSWKFLPEGVLQIYPFSHLATEYVGGFFVVSFLYEFDIRQVIRFQLFLVFFLLQNALEVRGLNLMICWEINELSGYFFNRKIF